MERHSRIATNMIAIVGKRLGEAQERLRELATQSADRRIARTLLRLLDQAGRRTGDGVRIEFPLRRKDIADIAGTTLHTVSRIVAGWERRGLLSSRNRHLVIASPDEIRRIAEHGSDRSEEHTSELQALMRISNADFCLKKKKITKT